MLIDTFNRNVNYLRISVTDRCNYRCTYCMTEEGVTLKPHAQILRYEDIASIVKEAAVLGITKIKLTGGEPLIKRNLEFLIAEIAATRGIADLGMTTNASLLSRERAQSLKKAGLMRVNISLDTLDPAHFSRITRCGNINDVLCGIDSALAADLKPVKINMIIFADTKPDEISRMKDFCREKGLVLQTINHFSLHSRDGKNYLEADRPPHCSECNRIRLTADGYLKPCLFSDQELKVDLNDIKGSLIRAVIGKPGSGRACLNRSMSQIGG